MKERVIAGCQFLTDGTRIWVNDAQGNSIARLNPRSIDVHAPGLAHTDRHCLDCGPADASVWPRFKESMLTHHGLHVPNDFKPSWCTIG